MTTAHRIEIVPTTAHVVVSRDGVVLAETDEPVLLHEGRLPTRYYIRPSDVKMDLLERSPSSSYCPFKGDASYWSLRDGPADIAWTYEEPIEGAEQIKGLVAFYNDKVSIEVGD